MNSQRFGKAILVIFALTVAGVLASCSTTQGCQTCDAYSELGEPQH